MIQLCRDCGADDGLVPFIDGGHRCYDAGGCARRQPAVRPPSFGQLPWFSEELLMLQVPSLAFGALPPASDPDIGVVVLAQAVEGRLYAAPVGTAEPVTSPVWVFCGVIAGPDPDNRFAVAVQSAWASYWDSR